MAGQHPRERPKLTPPSHPSQEDDGVPYTIITLQDKAVADYAGTTLLQVQEMDIFSYWLLLHDVVIYNKSQTEKGREWLRNAHRLNQTEPDLDTLRQHFGKGGG